MANSHQDLSHVSNEQLMRSLHDLVGREQALTAELLAHLGEVDHRRLYLDAAAPSLFSYCVEILHLPEDAAYKRIQAARLARRFPVVLGLVGEGALHLTSINLLAPHLTEDNHRELLVASRHKSKRQVEHLLATRFPQPNAPEVLRKRPAVQHTVTSQPKAVVGPARTLAFARAPATSPMTGTPPIQEVGAIVPTPTTGTRHAPSAPVARESSAVLPLASDRYRLQLTLSDKTRDKLLRARDLMSHQIPSGDLAEVLDRALSLLVDQLERRQFGRCRTREVAPAQAQTPPTASCAPVTPDTQCNINSGSKPSRSIARAVRREVAERDGYQCTFVAPDGRRCSARSRLQFHHLIPYAKGGPATVDNLRLCCQSHNLHHALADFGPGVIARAKRASKAGQTRCRLTREIGFRSARRTATPSIAKSNQTKSNQI